MESAGSKQARLIRVLRLGTMDYGEALHLQTAIADRVRDGAENETLLLVEHPHVLTVGVRGNKDNILADAADLERGGIRVFHIRRGGDVTYHGYGQLVGYPVVRFRPGDRNVRRLVVTLEEAIIKTLGDFGLTGSRRPSLTGVWVGRDKIASIGIGVARWVAQHGFALNVNTDLGYFDLIVPCGLRKTAMVSMERLLGHPVPMEEVMDSFERHFLGLTGMEREGGA